MPPAVEPAEPPTKLAKISKTGKATGHAEKALIQRADTEDAATWRHRLETFQQQTIQEARQ